MTSSLSKIKTKEPPNLSHSGTRGGYIHTCLQLYSSIECLDWKTAYFEKFRVMAERDTKLRSQLSKNIYLSHNFNLAVFEVPITQFFSLSHLNLPISHRRFAKKNCDFPKTRFGNEIICRYFGSQFPLIFYRFFPVTILL